MSLDDLGYSSCQKVPDDDAAIIAADRQESSKPVKLAGDGHGNTIQCAVIFLPEKDVSMSVIIMLNSP